MAKNKRPDLKAAQREGLKMLGIPEPHSRRHRELTALIGAYDRGSRGVTAREYNDWVREHKALTARYPELAGTYWAGKKNPRKRKRKRTRNPVNAHNLAHFAKWNRGGKHKWFTKAIAAKLPGIGGTSPQDKAHTRVAVKLFNPQGAGSWFITEANLETGEAFGYVTGLGHDELGYMDLNEMRAFRGRMGLPLERDEYFGSHTLAEVMEGKANPKARDPSHRKLLKSLDSHFARDEKALRKKSRRKNPDAYVIACYTGERGNKRLTYDATRNRFTDNSKPSLYRTQIAARSRASGLLKAHPKLYAYRIQVEPADAKERGSVFGARPRRNPQARPGAQAAQIEAAAKLQADFSGHEPGNIDTISVPAPAKVYTPVGKLTGVLYDTIRDGKPEKYVHRFRRKSRPLLLASHDGTQLRIAGGRFRFTEAGIEDE